MNKQNQPQHAAGGVHRCDDQATTQLKQTIAETVEQPEFGPDQLPELWQLVEASSLMKDGCITCWQSWSDEIETLHLRCETYPQHAKLAAVLDGLPAIAWHNPSWAAGIANTLLKQATPAQLQEALAHEQQHPNGWWGVSSHILAGATIEQLTGAVIEQLRWSHWMVMVSRGDGWGDDREHYVVEYIRQQLLGGDANAWTVFCGIAKEGPPIGVAAQIANAVEQQNRPS